MALPDSTIRFLAKAGMDDEYLKRLEALQSEDGREEDIIRILRQFRFELLRCLILGGKVIQKK